MHEIATEGHCAPSHILLGFTVDVETGDISLPPGVVDGAKSLLPGIVYGPRPTLATGRAFQELRGYYTHWHSENPAWKVIARPDDVLLGFLDAGGIRIQGASSEIWSEFRHTVSWMREQMEWGDVWNNLPKGGLARLLPLRGRFSGPNDAHPVTWLSSDSTLTRIGQSNYRNKESPCLPVGRLLEPFTLNTACGGGEHHRCGDVGN